MKIVEGSLIKKFQDSNGVTHYNCSVYTKTRGVLCNVWLIECDNVFSLHSTLDYKSFDKAFDEYLNKHNLKAEDC